MVAKLTGNAGVPLYATSFVNADTIVAGGGGGQGAHGVKNKLVVFKLGPGVLATASEFVFPDNSDSPTSLDASPDGSVWVGANAPADAKDNQHLQRFAVSDDGSIKWQHSVNAFQSRDASTYQRATAIAGTMVAAASSAVPGKVVVVSKESGDAVDLQFDFEISDMALSEYDEKERRFVLAAGEDVVELRSITAPATAWARVSPPRGHKWTRAAFIGPSTAVVASTIGQRKGVQLTLVSIGDDGVETTTAVAKVPRLAGVTAMAAGGGGLAVAGSSGDIAVYKTSGPSLTRTSVLKGVHAFPVTAIAVSSEGSVVSVSLDGSIVVHACLVKSGVSLVATLWWVLLSALFIAVIAILTNYQTVLRASRTFGIPGPQLFPSPDTTHSIGSEPHSSATAEQITHEPKVLEIPLHEGHGRGHGPVVYSEPRFVSEEASPETSPEESSEKAAPAGDHAEHAEL